jgi:hypothetical protein
MRDESFRVGRVIDGLLTLSYIEARVQSVGACGSRHHRKRWTASARRRTA